MPYFNVQIDTSEILEEVSDDELVREVARRKLNCAGHGANFTIPQRTAREAVIKAADEMRKLGNYALAFKLEEVRVDFVEQ